MTQDSNDQCACCDPVEGGVPACPQCRSSHRVTMTITQDMWEIQCLNCDIYFDGETGNQIFDILDEPAGLKPTSRTATTISKARRRCLSRLVRSVNRRQGRRG